MVKREGKLSNDERVDLLMDKIVIGVKKSFQTFLKQAIRENRKLVISQDGKVVTVPAHELKHLRKKKVTSSRTSN
jgi:hypothetical protein